MDRMPDFEREILKERIQAISLCKAPELEKPELLTVSRFEESMGEDRPYDPDDVQLLDFQIMLRYHWKRDGAVGVAEFLAEWTSRLGPLAWVPPKVFKAITNDPRRAVRIMTQIMCTIRDDIADCLMSGNLMSQYYNGTDRFRFTVQSELKIDTASGIYVNIIHLPQYRLDPTMNTQNYERHPHAGRSLTLAQLMHVTNKMELYLDDSRESNEYAKEVDHQKSYTKKLDYGQGDHRYSLNDSQQRKITGWIETIREIYGDKYDQIVAADPDDPLLHTPMARCFMEVGWSQFVQRRLTNHLTHEGTTNLYGLFEAILEREYGDTKFRFTVSQWHVIQLTSSDHAQIGEILITLLCSSFSFIGGLNYSPPGQFNSDALDVDNQRDQVVRNQRRLWEGRQIMKNLAIDKEKVNRTTRLEKNKLALPDLEKAVVEIDKEKAEKLAELKKLLEDEDEYFRQKDAIDDLDRLVEQCGLTTKGFQKAPNTNDSQ